MTRIAVTRTYLELRRPEELRASAAPPRTPALARAWPIGADDYLAVYTLVGARWHWRDRLAWTRARLDAHLASPDVQVWVARLDDEVAGYFELQRLSDDARELVYFGLSAAFIGRGLGGWLLTRAVEIALAEGASRISLNTCTLDGPAALPNYLARGFRIVREEVYEAQIGEPAGDAAGALQTPALDPGVERS